MRRLASGSWLHLQHAIYSTNPQPFHTQSFIHRRIQADTQEHCRPSTPHSGVSEVEPRRGRNQASVHAFNIANPFAGEPVLQRAGALLDKNVHTIFPGCATAEHAGKIDVRFRGKFQPELKCCVTYAFRKVDKWNASATRGLQTEIHGFFPGVAWLAVLSRSSRYQGAIHWRGKT